MFMAIIAFGVMAMIAYSFKWDHIFVDEPYDDLSAVIYMVEFILFIYGVIDAY